MTHPFIHVTDSQAIYGTAQALPLLVIDSPKCYAVISLQGGQILEFNAKEKPPLLWLSPKVIFELGTAIRGGIPICAPWFGPHRAQQRSNFTYPNHGFARTSMWQQQESRVEGNDDVLITLSLAHSASTLAIYPHEFEMQITFGLSEGLSIEYTMANRGEGPMPCEWALHSYFAIDNIADIRVDGLDGLDYIDSADNNAQQTLSDAVVFKQQVDRYFIAGSDTQSINTAATISIAGENCPSVITWNPGQALAGKMKDIGNDNYHRFVCVERGAIYDKMWLIPSQQSISATMTLRN